MNKKKKTVENPLATLLAFEKKLVPSDGLFYGTRWDVRKDATHETLLPLREKSVRGTNSNWVKDESSDDPLRLNVKAESPNPQTIDAVSLGFQQDTLKVKFTLKILPGAAVPSSCNSNEHRKQIEEMGKNYTEQFKFEELAKRYAINIANARYLWRNRVGAEKLEVHVTAPQVQESWIFDPYQFELQDFAIDSLPEETQKDIDRLAGLIREAFIADPRKFLFLEIEAFALLGKGQEIYPSEELVLDKGKKDKSKILYEVEGTAALHSQKIGNALRTIDTWYPSDEEFPYIGPIAIEPYGAVTNRGIAYRATKAKNFYTLFNQYARGEMMAADDAHYVMAVLIRGGVFGQGGKKSTGTKEETAKTE